MFQMNKALSKHIWPLDSDDGTASTIVFYFLFEVQSVHLNWWVTVDHIFQCHLNDLRILF